MARKTQGQTNIYSAKGSFIASQPYDIEMWLANPVRFYHEYKPGMIGTDMLYDFPIVENGKLREMTIEEQITSGVTVLGAGQKYDPLTKTIVDVPKPDGILKYEWDFDGFFWYEGATKEELQAWLSEKVYTWRDEIWEEGFDYVKSSDGTHHHQRLRTTDSNRITETVQFMDKAKATGIPVQSVRWQFSENDIDTMGYADMNELFVYGAAYTQVGFDVMAKWRAKEDVNLLVDTKENFKAEMVKSFNEMIAQIATKF